MQLDKLDMSNPLTVILVVAVGCLGLGMCVQLVFLFATLFKSDKPVRKSTRTRKKPNHLDDHVVPDMKKKSPTRAAAAPKTPKSTKKSSTKVADEILSPTRRSTRIAKTPAKKYA